jgi:putative ABC transport system permease protein
MNWVRQLFSRSRLYDDLSEEIRGHLEEKIEELVAGGMSRKEATYAASREFGNITLTEEKSREVWQWPSIENFLMDLRYAFRTLRSSPGFTVIAELTLALGIGANTAVFSLVNATLLRPLPYPQPDQLVHIYSTRAGGSMDTSPLDARDLAQENHTFEGMALHDAWRKSVSGLPDHAGAEQQAVGIVQSRWFDLLRVRPIIGSVWAPDQDQPGRNYVVVVGERFWRERFHADQNVLGKIIKINDEGYTIIGVVPDVGQPWFYWNVGLWTPFVPYTQVWQESNRGNRGYWVLGRLKAGVSLAQARADLNTVAASLATRYPADREIGVNFRPLKELRGDGSQHVLLLLSGAVGLILLIACANLANLLLARNARRHREFAVRSAIGAGRSALVRMLLVESALLGVGGGALGLIVASLAPAALVRWHPSPLTHLASSALDWRVLFFSFAVSLVTAGAFGILPSLAGTRGDVAGSLREGGRSEMAGIGSNRLRQALVVSELALSLMLLTGAGLLIRSILNMQNQDLGFSTRQVLTARFILPVSFRMRGTESPSFINRFADELSRRVMALPGVKSATISASVPPDEGWKELFTVERHPATSMSAVPETRFNLVDWRYRSTIGIPLIRGRDFADSDNETTISVALVNQTFAERHFKNEDPIGQRVYLGPPDYLLSQSAGERGPIARFTIVGVLRDARNNGLALPTQPEIIGLSRQTPTMNYGFKRITLRTTIAPHALAEALRHEVQALDPDVPLTDVMTMEERVSTLLEDNRFTTILLSLLAGVGVFLAIIGIYGVVSYLVAQRTQEFGVRLALGASPAGLLWMTLRQGLIMALIGSVCGLLGAIAAQHSIAAFLYGVSVFDPLTVASAAFLLVLVALLACAIPAYRAMRIDPMVALRYE